jgi:molybdenum cofactor biosynthesis enzyme
MRQAQAVFPGFSLRAQATARIERARGAMTRRAKAAAAAAVAAMRKLNPLCLDQSQVEVELRFVIESVGPLMHSVSVLMARTRLELHSKLTVKTALDAIYAEVDTTVQKSMMRTCIILSKVAKWSRTRSTMATFGP